MKLRRQLLLLIPCAVALLAGANVSEAQSRKSSVEGRFEKLAGFTFEQLPLADAIKVVHGDGKRKLAVFSDPNCGHCKRVDQDLKKIGNVTVYVFLYPILGADSVARSRNVWCNKERTKTWESWMQSGTEPAPAAGACDAAALQRNADFGRKLGVKGTPTMIFKDGTRVPGAISADWIEQLLVASER